MSLERGICLPRQLAYLPCGEKVPGCVSAHPACEWWRNIDAGGVDSQVAYAKGIPIVKKVGDCRPGVEVPGLLTKFFLPMCHAHKR
jgi:hypothetical protein